MYSYLPSSFSSVSLNPTRGIPIDLPTVADMTDDISRPYKSTVNIALPSIQYAQHLKDVVSVDEEVSNKVVKSFSIVTPQEVDGSDDDRGNDAIVRDAEDDNTRRVLRM